MCQSRHDYWCIERLLATDSAERLSLPGQDRRHTLEQGSGSEGLHSGCCPGQDPQACDATHHATLLRDRTPGGRSRLDGHQPTAGAQQLYFNEMIYLCRIYN